MHSDQGLPSNRSCSYCTLLSAVRACIYPAVPNQALLTGFIDQNRPALDAMRGVTVVALWEMRGVYAGCILGSALCSQHAGCHAAVLQEAPLLVDGGCCRQAVRACVRLRDAQTGNSRSVRC